MRRTVALRLVAVTSAFVAAGCGDDFSLQEDQDGTVDAAGLDAPVNDAAVTGAELGDSDVDSSSNDTAKSDTQTGDSLAADADGVNVADAAKDTGPAKLACKIDADCGDGAPCFPRRCLPTDGGNWCASVQATDGAKCDDGDVCTVTSQCTAGKCEGAGASGCGCKEDEDCYKFDDENYCNGFYECDTKSDPPHCVLDPTTIVTCPKSTDPCNPTVCYESVGDCKPAPAQDGQPCVDAQPCMADPVCVGGKCEGQTAVCECQKDADCAAVDDEDLCNGVLFCNNKSFPYKCTTSPASVPECGGLNDTACDKNTCKAKTGKCEMVPVKDKTGCEDGDACTSNDTCFSGSCVPGTQICPCEKSEDCGKFEDGDLCNGTLYCEAQKTPSACVINPASLVHCEASEKACVTGSCAKKQGKCVLADAQAGSACDDGDPCTAGDHCTSGKCESSAAVCKCKADADCASKSGNACKGAMFCDKSKAPFQCRFNPNKQVVCKVTDDTVCLVSRCDKKDGKCKMASVSEGKTCDADGNPCTQGDVCTAGKCQVGTNVCQCEKDAECSKFEDDNACNGALFCDKSKLPLLCELNPATIVTCKTVNDTVCSANRCDKKSGKCGAEPINDGLQCDADGDGGKCTKSDVCAAGKCDLGTNTCACTSNAGCASLGDGNACNGTLYCDTSTKPNACKLLPDSVVVCPQDSGKPCVTSKCAPKDGKCSPEDSADGSKCQDGAPCTTGETCNGGKCELGKGSESICDCLTDDYCDKTFGTKDPCDELFKCDKSKAIWACKKMSFTAVECPDAKLPCANLECDTKTGVCVQKPSGSNGNKCEDGDPCTAAGSCEGVQCKAASPVTCNDENECTDDSCTKNIGCAFFKLSTKKCDDGKKCTGDDHCVNGQCKGEPIQGCK